MFHGLYSFEIKLELVLILTSWSQNFSKDDSTLDFIYHAVCLVHMSLTLGIGKENAGNILKTIRTTLVACYFSAYVTIFEHIQWNIRHVNIVLLFRILSNNH